MDAVFCPVILPCHELLRKFHISNSLRHHVRQTEGERGGGEGEREGGRDAQRQ